MKATHLQYETYQLAAEYELGEPIRVYRVKLPGVTDLLANIVLLSLMIVCPLALRGFQLDSATLAASGFIILVIAGITLYSFISYWRERKFAIYICPTGFIVRAKDHTRAVRWAEIESVTTGEKDESCVIILRDETSIEPDTLGAGRESGLFDSPSFQLLYIAPEKWRKVDLHLSP